MLGRDPLHLPAAAALAIVAGVTWYGADFFGHEVLAEIAIFAIFAMSLDLLVGYAGLVSLGHAAFFALGAYATAAFTVFLGWPVSVATVGAVGCAAALAAVSGVFAIRTGGVFFIMITLALGQMVYAYFFKAREFGPMTAWPASRAPTSRRWGWTRTTRRSSPPSRFSPRWRCGHCSG